MKCRTLYMGGVIVVTWFHNKTGPERRLDGLKSHDIHMEFHKNWFKNLKVGRWDSQPQTDNRERGKLIRVLLYFQNKKSGLKRSRHCAVLRFYLIRLEGLSKPTKHRPQDSWSPDRDSNLGFSEYKVGMLPTTPRLLQTFLSKSRSRAYNSRLLCPRNGIYSVNVIYFGKIVLQNKCPNNHEGGMGLISWYLFPKQRILQVSVPHQSVTYKYYLTGF
jgi:hypothetical protein